MHQAVVYTLSSMEKIFVMSSLQDISPTVTFAFSVLFMFLLVKLVIFQAGYGHQRQLPRGSRPVPGPLGLPIIGNILQLGKEPHISLFRLAEKYGDVLQVKIGSRPVVVLNGQHSIRQALVRQTVDFAGRPNFKGFERIVSINGGSVAFTTYSEGWKLCRKLTGKALRHFTCGKRSSSVEAKVKSEATEFINYILRDHERAVFNPTQLMKLAVSNILANFIFQVRLDLDHKELRGLVKQGDKFVDASSGSNLADFMPWYGILFPAKTREFEVLAGQLRDLLLVYIDEHLDKYEQGLESDILYYLMTLTNSHDPSVLESLNLTAENIRGVVYDLYGAGIETVAGNLLWAILYALYFPEMQEQIRKEIDRVVGRDRLPSLFDKGKLPFTEAFLAEVARHASVLPTALPHSTTRDTVLRGGYDFFIPKDTVVMVNLYSVHHDPEQWDRPEVFNPNRFLCENGATLDIDKVNSMMRFSVGRRRCLGSELAQMEEFLFFTVILHQCFLKNVDGQTLSLKGNGALLITTPPPYKMEITKR